MNHDSSANDTLAASIFAPDPVARFMHERAHGIEKGSPDQQPLRALMLAVLEDGIACFQDYVFQPTAANERLSLEAEEWIRSDSDELFSFNTICDTLGLNADRLRKALEQWRSGRVKSSPNDRRRPAANKAGGKGTEVVKISARHADHRKRRAYAGGSVAGEKV